MLGGISLIAAVVIFLLLTFSEQLAGYVPFSAEKKLADHMQQQLKVDEQHAFQPYLQQLGEHIAAVSDLPEDMTISVHYADNDTVNAFATLGGHIVVFRGLIEQMPNENALAMVLAHEIAHIKHRHPIKALGRSVVLGAALAVFDLSAGSDMASRTLGDMGLLTILSFNREQERQADETALSAIYQLYGHVAGADSVFKRFGELEGSHITPELFNSHPYSENRRSAIEALAKKQAWPITGSLAPLPALGSSMNSEIE